jgi:hypothetical protein
MNNHPAIDTAAAGTAPPIAQEVFLRDHDGGAKRIPAHIANDLVESGLADRVSRAGHVRLKLGFRIDKLDSYRGAGASVTTTGREDRKEPHPRCHQWKSR